MPARLGHLLSGRWAALLALCLPVLAGLGYLAWDGALDTYLATNAIALLLGLAAVFALRAPEALGTVRILLAILLIVLALPLVTGPEIKGIARWIPLGPVQLHAGSIALPAFACLAARDENMRVGWLLAATFFAVLQPDAACAFALCGAAAGLYFSGGDWRDAVATGVAFFAGIAASIRGELPVQPFVERVLVTLSLEAPFLALVLFASLVASFFLIAHALYRPKPERFALAGALFGFSLLGVVSNYPSVLIGYGASPILGFGLALALSHKPIHGLDRRIPA